MNGEAKLLKKMFSINFHYRTFTFNSAQYAVIVKQNSY